MSLLFADGFDHYSGGASIKWDGYSRDVSGFQADIANAGRYGNGLYACNSGDGRQGVWLGVANKQELVMGAAFYPTAWDPTAWGAGNPTVFILNDVETVQVSLRVVKGSKGLQLAVYRGLTTAALAVSDLPLRLNSWYYVEMRVKIHGTSGGAEVRVDGAPVIEIGSYADTPTALNTMSSVNAYVNRFYIGGMSDSTGYGMWCAWDDVYLCDTSGSVNNDFLGEVRIDTLFPESDGAYSEWVASAAETHCLLVDDPTPDGRDYVSSGTVGATDTYRMSQHVNVALPVLGAVATCESNVNGSSGASAAINATAGDGWIGRGWLVVDLASMRLVDGFRLRYETNYTNNFGWGYQPYAVDVSVDAVTWTPVFTRVHPPAADMDEHGMFPVQMARYVRLRPIPEDGRTTLSVETFAVYSPAIVPAGTVHAIQHMVYAKKDDAGTRSIAMAQRSGGEDHAGGAHAVGASWAYLREVVEVNPATLVPFTPADINDSEFGVILTA